jgi:hypothetical protein
MPKAKHVGLFIGGFAAVTQFLGLLLYLWHERDHDRTDYTMDVLIVAVFIVSIVVTAWAVRQNLKDASRAESLQAQIVTIKDEHTLYVEGLRKQVEHGRETASENFKKYQAEVEAHNVTKRCTPIFNSISAQWGNDNNKKEVGDIIERMPRNAVAFHLCPDAFKPYDPLRADPAPGDDNKHLDVTFSYAGWPLTTVYKKQGEWVVLPVDPSVTEMQKKLASMALPVIDVSWGDAETSWQKGFTLIYRGGDDPLTNVTIKPISKGGYTATFNMIPFLQKGVPAYLIPEVKVERDPLVRGEFKSLFEYPDLVTGVIAFSVVSTGPRQFEVEYRAEGHIVHDDITVFVEAQT